MPLNLVKHMSVGNAPLLDAGEPVCYTVAGLPPGEEAKIVQIDYKWQIVRDGEWSGHYASAQEALNALEREFSDRKP
jgi:hypothetical protein